MTTRVITYEITGNPPDTPVTINDSTGLTLTSSDPAELLAFLRYRHKDVLRAFWDLDESIAPILRMLPVAVLKSLASFDENTVYGNHQLYYLPDRGLRIGRSRFYSLKHFWATDTPAPKTLAETQDGADELIRTLADCGMPDPVKLTSPIAIFELSAKGKEIYASIPKGHELPKDKWEALEYAYQADRREWITAYQVGHWLEGGIWSYDISSAYPSRASELVDLRDCDLWKSDTMGDREHEALYGLLRGRLLLNPDAEYIHASPMISDKERLPCNPAGDFGDDYYCTLDEVRFIERYNIGEFQLADGWFINLKDGVTPKYPFKVIMDYLYQQRSGSTLASSIMKGIANQLIGKLIETKVTGDYGVLRNDIYHALILARLRVKVAELLVKNDIQASELVAVQTDGCRLTRNIPMPTNGFGKWCCKGTQPTIVASPYKVYVGDKKPGHLTYEMITDMIAEHPLSQYYANTVKHRTTLRQALQQDDITLVGKVDDLPAHLDMNMIDREQNRIFPKMPATGASLLSGKYLSTTIVLS